MFRTIIFCFLLSLLLLPYAAGETLPGYHLPYIDRIVPNPIDACSLQTGKSISILGKFPLNTRILLDGAEVPALKVEEGEIVFALPALRGGLHRLEVVARGQRSLPQALIIDTLPKITAVTVGEDRVTAYEVRIGGVNFLFESILVVNGAALRPAQGEEPDHSPPGGGRDYVRYEDCASLVYVRHPLTREAQTITFRVVNPGGEQSPEYEVEIP